MEPEQFEEIKEVNNNTLFKIFAISFTLTMIIIGTIEKNLAIVAMSLVFLAIYIVIIVVDGCDEI